MENNELTPSNEVYDINEFIGIDTAATDVVSALLGPLEAPFSLASTAVFPSLPTDLTENSSHGNNTSPSSISDVFNDLRVVDEYSRPEFPEVTQPSVTTQNRRGSSMHATNRRYRIHLGTRPGFYTSELFTYEQSQWRHQQLVNLLSQFRSNLKDLLLGHFQFDILLRDAFSTTEAWGLEPYASIIFESGALVRLEGVAAIIGRIFRQDGIGIFDEEDDYQEYPIGTTSDNFNVHRFFAISRSDVSNDLSIPEDDAKTIMMVIRENYPHLSGQFGRTNGTIELHEYGNIDQTLTVNSLQEIIKSVFIGHNYLYRVEERKAKSKLLFENEYDEAIKQAEFEVLATIIQTVRLHDTLYNSN